MEFILEPVVILGIVLLFNYLVRQSLNKDRQEKDIKPPAKTAMPASRQRAAS